MRRGAAGGVCFTWSIINAMITTTNDNPLREKQEVMPNIASAPPASSGPTTRARLNWIELSAIALGRSFFSTNVGTKAWDAGPPKAWAEPVINDSTIIGQTWFKPKNTRAASVNAVDI